MYDLEASGGDSGSHQTTLSRKAFHQLRERAARFNGKMAAIAIFGGSAIMLFLGGIGYCMKDEDGKLDDCKAAKYAYAGVLVFGCFMYTLPLLGLLLPYFALPRWLTCGCRVGGYMPTRWEDLRAIRGDDPPYFVDFCEILRAMGTFIRERRKFGVVALTSLVFFVGLCVVLLPGILGFFMPQFLRPSLPADCYVPRVGW